MTEREIFVPLLVWLIGGSRIGGTYNDYYGCVTRNPAQPMLSQPVFNYRIAVERADDDEERLRVSWYPGVLSFKNTPPEDVTSELFPCSEDSLPQAKAWLQAELQQYFDA